MDMIKNSEYLIKANRLAFTLCLMTLSLICEAEESSENTEIVPNDAVETEVPTGEVKVAPNVDLKEVAPPPEPVLDKKEDAEEKTVSKKPESVHEVIEESFYKNKVFPEAVRSKLKVESEELVLLGSKVPRGTATRLAWSPQVSISGLSLPTPVLVINGEDPGPTLCLTGAIHGDELNGIEVVRRVMYDIKPKDLNGTLIGVPIVNLQGFQRGSRYLSDRRDLNRYFPGEKDGSLASRIAHSLFTEVIQYCDYLIDLHTGSLRRTNLPQIRANISNERVAEFVESFDKIAIVHHQGNPGMLRTAANNAGIISITMELGESLRVQESQIDAGTHSVNSLLDNLNMYPRVLIWGEPRPTYFESTWVRVEKGGILFSQMGLGDKVAVGDILGTVTDPITNQSEDLQAPISGQIIGMAVNQVVVPGFAAYHIGIESNQEEMTKVTTEDGAKTASGDGPE